MLNRADMSCDKSHHVVQVKAHHGMYSSCATRFLGRHIMSSAMLGHYVMQAISGPPLFVGVPFRMISAADIQRICMYQIL